MTFDHIKGVGGASKLNSLLHLTGNRECGVACVRALNKNNCFSFIKSIHLFLQSVGSGGCSNDVIVVKDRLNCRNKGGYSLVVRIILVVFEVLKSVL